MKINEKTKELYIIIIIFNAIMFSQSYRQITEISIDIIRISIGKLHEKLR